jgi:hypothetical protein
MPTFYAEKQFRLLEERCAFEYFSSGTVLLH